MIFAKSRSTYFYIFILCLSVISFSFLASEGIIASVNIKGGFIQNVVFCAALIVAGGLFSLFSIPLSKVNTDKEGPSGFMEGITVFFILISSLMARFICITFSNVNYAEISHLFNQIIKGNLFVGSVNSPLVLFYASIARVLFGIFGTNSLMLLYLQTFVILITSLLLYVVVKKLNGKIAAFSSLLLFSFLPCSIKMSVYPSYDCFLALFFIIFLYIVVKIFSIKYKGRLEKKSGIFQFLFIGICAGLFTFFDQSGWILIFFLIYTAFNIKQDFTKAINSGRGESFLIIIGYIIGFLVGITLERLFVPKSFMQLLINYFEDLTDLNFSRIYFDSVFTDYSYIVIIVLMFVLFFRSFKIQRNYFLQISLVLAGICAVKVCGLTMNSYNCYPLLVSVIIAGSGIASLFKNDISKYNIQPIKISKDDDTMKNGLKKHDKTPSFSLEIDKKPQVDSKKLEASLEFLQKKPETPADNTVSVSNENNLQPINSTENNAADDSENTTGSAAVTKVGDAISPVTEKLFESDSLNNIKPAASSGNISISNMSNEVTLKADIPNNDQSVSDPVNTKEPLKPQEPLKSEESLKTEDTLKIEQENNVTANNPINDAVQNKPEQQPVKPAVPISKFGRRMDYKTAIVSAGPENAGLNKTNSAVTPLVTPVITTPVAPLTTPEVKPISAGIKEPNIDTPSTNIENTYTEIPQVKAPELIKNESESKSEKPQNNPVEPAGPIIPKPVTPADIAKLTPVSSEPIKNPLPTPKKHIAKSMNFDIEPAMSQMHFDIVDMHGKDYFDIN